MSRGGPRPGDSPASGSIARGPTAAIAERRARTSDSSPVPRRTRPSSPEATSGSLDAARTRRIRFFLGWKLATERRYGRPSGSPRSALTPGRSPSVAGSKNRSSAPLGTYATLPRQSGKVSRSRSVLNRETDAIRSARAERPGEPLEPPRASLAHVLEHVVAGHRATRPAGRDVIFGRGVDPVDLPRPEFQRRPGRHPPPPQGVARPERQLGPRQGRPATPSRPSPPARSPAPRPRSGRLRAGAPAAPTAPARGGSRPSAPGTRPCRRPGRPGSMAPSGPTPTPRRRPRPSRSPRDDPSRHQRQADQDPDHEPPGIPPRGVLARLVPAAMGTADGILVHRLETIRAGDRLVVLIIVGSGSSGNSRSSRSASSSSRYGIRPPRPSAGETQPEGPSSTRSFRGRAGGIVGEGASACQFPRDRSDARLDRDSRCVTLLSSASRGRRCASVRRLLGPGPNSRGSASTRSRDRNLSGRDRPGAWDSGIYAHDQPARPQAASTGDLQDQIARCSSAARSSAGSASRSRR